jgi:hypothetical protein
VWSKVDNVDIDAETGDLWIGTHPNMFVVLQHLGDPGVRSPSQVCMVERSLAVQNGRQCASYLPITQHSAA